MDIASLSAFIEVARHESFSKASTYLHLTQPAVSKRVAALEESLGTKLFNRIGRHVSLTQSGEQLLLKAQDLVNQAQDMKRYASTLGDNVSGPLKIAISHHIGLHRLPPILRQFRKRFSDVELDIQFEESEQAARLVELGDIEFALVTLPERLPDNLLAEAVWHDYLQLVVGHDHPLVNQKQPITLTAFFDYPCVLPTPETETFAIIQRELAPLDLTEKLQMSTNNLETLKMLVVAGIGWSLLPQTMLDDDLVVVKSTHEFSRQLGMITHRKRSFSNAARAMHDLILSEI